MTSAEKISVAAAVSVLTIMIGAFFFARPPVVVVDFFAVGQGDAVLVRSAGKEVLIDGGPDRTILAKLGAVMPFFDRTIEYVAITHPHTDHINGLIAVFERYRVGKVLIPATRTETPEFAVLTEIIRAAGTEVVEVGRGDTLKIGEATLTVLWPPLSARRSDDLASVLADANDGSLVMRLAAFCDDRPAAVGDDDCGDAIFTGDATKEVEGRLAAAGGPLRARVLKVGHHGSSRSTSKAWIELVRPELAVIEVGKNSYGHPSFSLLSRLRAAGIEVRRTDRDGDIRVVFDRSGMRLPRRLPGF